MANRPTLFGYANVNQVLRSIYHPISVALFCLVSVANPSSQASDASKGDPTSRVRSSDLNAAVSLALVQNRIREREFRRLASKRISNKWYTFASPDGDFTLAFPLKPSSEEADQGTVTLIRAFGVTTDSGMRFSVNFQDNGGDPRAIENNKWARDLEKLASAADRKDGRQVVQTHRLAKNIVETELWQTVPANGANINYLRRSILWRARVYTLSCGSVVNGQRVNKTICQRFFDSIRFIRKPRR